MTHNYHNRSQINTAPAVNVHEQMSNKNEGLTAATTAYAYKHQETSRGTVILASILGKSTFFYQMIKTNHC